MKKVATICLVFLITLSSLTSCVHKSNTDFVKETYLQNPYSDHITAGELLKKQLGDVYTIVPNLEKQELTEKLEMVMMLKEKAIAKGSVEATKEQLNLLKELNDAYNKYTIQSVGKDIDALIKEQEKKDKVPFDAYKNNILENLKPILSKKDYDSLYKITYDVYNDDMDSSVASYEIESILQKYRKLDSATLTFELAMIPMLTHAVFTVDPSNLNLTYTPIPYVTPETLPKEELDSYYAIWDIIRNIIPKHSLGAFSEFRVFSDGVLGVLAFVVANDDIGASWSVAIDDLDTQDVAELISTIIHEYMHYITLNHSQVLYTDKQTLDTYNSVGMVTQKYAYLDLFYKAFWKDLLDDRLINPHTFNFYIRHQTEFVSAYASTSPIEDIAESFVCFVLLQKQAGNTIAEQKINFFYDYPELVEIRQELRENIKQNNAFISSFKK